MKRRRRLTSVVFIKLLSTLRLGGGGLVGAWGLTEITGSSSKMLFLFASIS